MTEQPTKKITAANAIEMLVHCINRGDMAAFYKHAENYHGGLAHGADLWHRLGRILKDRPKGMTSLDSLNSAVKGLVSQVALEDENVFVNEVTGAFLNELFTEWANRDLYNYHNLGVRSKILLHGPTGNGKTTLVKHIARAAGLPLVEVSADRVISSSLGSTGANINKVFDALHEPCVLFWDEIDTVGRMRGSGHDSSSASVENDRMVNSMLVNMERLDPSVVFIGATNRYDMLDSAFLRRFHAIYELPNPSAEEKRSFARQLAGFYNLPAHLSVIDVSAHQNFSGIKQAIIDKARRYIVSQIAERQAA